MLVKDLMSKDLVLADTNDTVFDVVKLMRHHNIGAVPVVAHGDQVLGMVTDRDIVLNMAKEEFDPYKTFASSIMSDKVYSVKPDAEVHFALDLMKKQQIRRLPVIENERLIGMLSIGDIAASDKFNMEVSETLTEISLPSEPENI